MAIADAIQRGMPVVSTPCGVLAALPSIGSVVTAPRPDALSQAISTVLIDVGRQERLRRVAAELWMPSWEDQGELFVAEVLQPLLSGT